MRKSLVIVMMLALVFSLSLGVMAQELEANCTGDCGNDCTNCSQEVNVKAPYILNCIGTDEAVDFEFGMDEYELGYIEAMNQMSIEVGAPASWTVGAVANHNNRGVASALLVSGGAGWKDISHTSPLAIKSGGQGVTLFPIHYRIELDDLTDGGNDINETVTVTYNFM